MRKHMIDNPALDRLSAQNISFLEALKYHSESIPDKIAVCYLEADSARTLSYRQLNKCARAAAVKLAEGGLCRGDRCMLLADNSAEWILAYLAIMLCGATVIPLDPQTSADTLEGLVRFSQPRMLVRQKGHAQGFVSPPALVEKEPVSIVEALSTSASRSMFPDRRGVEQAIIFTSGTTGDPKGVVLSEENFLANIRDLLQTGFLNPDMRALAILPFFHAYPFTASLAAPLYGGGTVVLSASPRADDIAQAIKAFHPTHLIAVPRVLRLLVEGIRRKLRDRGIIGRLLAGLMSLSAGLEKRTWLNPVCFLLSPVRKTALGSARWVISGGARLEPDVAYAIKGLGFRLYEGYGLTETSPVLTINPLGRPRVGSVGVALPSVTVALKDEENGIGEIIARGPSVFLGYFQRP
ncbi:MAG: AMP-binding protein, partial [Candidatus Brocadiia bacterium]